MEVEETTSEPVKNDGLTMADLTKDESLPEVNAPAVEAVRKSEEEEKATLQKAQSEAKYGFKPDGTPRKKPGRQKIAAKQPEKPFYTGDASAPQVSKSIQAAVTVSGILEQLQIKMISPEFAYTQDERIQNIQAWDKTFEYYGGVSLPPPVELAMSHASIIMSRAATGQETQTKLQHFGVWLKSKFKRKQKGEENALSGSGQDAERENNVRQEKDTSNKKWL